MGSICDVCHAKELECKAIRLKNFLRKRKRHRDEIEDFIN